MSGVLWTVYRTHFVAHSNNFVSLKGLTFHVHEESILQFLFWSRKVHPLTESRGRDSFNQNFRPVRPGKVVHLKRWTSFFETFPVGPNRSIEFWTEISGNLGWIDRAHGNIPWNNKFAFQFYHLTLVLSWTTHLLAFPFSFEYKNHVFRFQWTLWLAGL